MAGLGVEFRSSRMLWWGLITGVGSVVMAVLALERWQDSVAQASVWAAMPLTYLGAVIVAGAADSERLRRSTSFADLRRASGRPGWQASGAHFVVVLLYGAVLPIVLPSVVVLVGAQFGARHGVSTLNYVFLAALFLVGSVALGTTIGVLVRSRFAAVLLGLAVGLGFSLFAFPVPPSNRAWLQVSPDRLVLLIAIVGALVAGMVFAAAEVRNRLRQVFMALGAAATAAAVVCAWLFAGLDKQTERQRDDAGVCNDSGSYPVCVWPGDEHYLSDVVAMSGRLELLNDRMSGPDAWTIAEPGLQVSKPALTITPPGEGVGMWLVAENMAFGLMNELPIGMCDYEKLADDDEFHVLNWAVAEAMTNFVYGGSRPSMIQSSDSLDARIQQLATAVGELPQDEQLVWIEKTWNETTQC